MGDIFRRLKESFVNFTGVGLDPDSLVHKQWMRRKQLHYGLYADIDERGIDVVDAPGLRRRNKKLKTVWHVLGFRPKCCPCVRKDEDEVDTTLIDGDRRSKVCCNNVFCNCICRAPRKKYLVDGLPIRDEDDDEVPYFTYYITFVQTIILICTLAIYGFGAFGFKEITTKEVVLKPNLALELDQRSEFGNMWGGPDQQSLIHLGAKYSPCMRKDPNIAELLMLDREEERKSGCCVRDDGSGCVQTVPEKCSSILSTFVRWDSSSYIKGGYKSGAVCGLDPRYCKKPASTPPFEWDKNDFTEWPKLKRIMRVNTYNMVKQKYVRIPANQGISNLTVQTNYSDCHMTCDLLGRPCCHGIQGECMITTREHCEFRQGFFHEDKFLCSQVNCMEQVCGMIPFVYEDRPDQFSRVLSANLLHAGIIQLVLTLLFQLILMRGTEKEIGWLRMMIIYMGSGIMGTLASAVLVPYQVGVGPSAAQWGVIACILVEVIDMIVGDKWENTKLYMALGVIIIASVVMFVLGLLLPFIDNVANFFGGLTGALLAIMLLKDIEKGCCNRVVAFMVSFILLALMFIILMIIFYVAPLSDASWIKYLNCQDFTDSFCRNMDVVPHDRGATYSRYT